MASRSICSQDCHGKAVRGETTGGATCSACQKRFRVELVSQVVRVRGELRHACSDECRRQILAEAGGARLGAIAAAQHPPMPLVGADMSSPPKAPLPAVTSELPHHAKRTLHAPSRLAIFNHKGGTGKTTTSVSLAAGLASRGLRVLLVDTDSQGNVGVSLGVKAEKTLYHVLVMGVRAEATRRSACARTSISSPRTRRWRPRSSTSPVARTATASCATGWRRPSTPTTSCSSTARRRFRS